MRKSVFDGERARNGLRVADLLNKTRGGGGRLMNIKMPVALFDRIEEIANEFGASKTEVVVALLNDGLESARKRGSGKRL